MRREEKRAASTFCTVMGDSVKHTGADQQLYTQEVKMGDTAALPQLKRK